MLGCIPGHRAPRVSGRTDLSESVTNRSRGMTLQASPYGPWIATLLFDDS